MPECSGGLPLFELELVLQVCRKERVQVNMEKKTCSGRPPGCCFFISYSSFSRQRYCTLFVLPHIHSKDMARNCSIDAAEKGVLPGFVDLGVAGQDGHTAYSRNPETTAVNAFIDYLYLMDADIIVRSGSSFSGTVVKMKGMRCHKALSGVDVPVSGIFVCLPTIC